jgi:hypothetical protein
MVDGKTNVRVDGVDRKASGAAAAASGEAPISNTARILDISIS